MTRLLPALAVCTMAAFVLAATPASAGPVIPIVGDTDCVFYVITAHIMHSASTSASSASAASSDSDGLCGDPGLGFWSNCTNYLVDVGVQAYGEDVQVCVDQDSAGNPCLSVYVNGNPLSRTCVDQDSAGNTCASTYIGSGGVADRTCEGAYPGEGYLCVGHTVAAGNQVDDHLCLGTDEEPYNNLCVADGVFLNGAEQARDRTCEGTYTADGSPCVAHRVTATLLGLPVEDRLCAYYDPATGDPCVQDVVYVYGSEVARDAQCVHVNLANPFDLCTYNVATKSASFLASASLCANGLGSSTPCVVVQAQALSISNSQPVCPIVPDVTPCEAYDPYYYAGYVGVVVDYQPTGPGGSDTPVCILQPAVSQCTSGTGYMVNGDPATCVPDPPSAVATCAAYGGAYAGQTGVVVDNMPAGPSPNDQPACVGTCPSPGVGYMVNNNPGTCVQGLPSNASTCSSYGGAYANQYGVVVDYPPAGPSGNDQPVCLAPCPASGPLGPVGVGLGIVLNNSPTCYVPPTQGNCPPGWTGTVVDNDPPGPGGNDLPVCVLITQCTTGIGYMVNGNPITCVTPPPVCPTTFNPSPGWAPGVNGVCVGLPWVVPGQGSSAYCPGTGTTASVTIDWGTTPFAPAPSTSVCI